MITSQQMRELEKRALQKDISALELMENAGKQVFSAVRRKYGLNDKNIVIFCGQGNNGADGFAAARYFAEQCPTLILFFGEKEKLSEEALENYELVKKRVNIINIKEQSDLRQFHFQQHLHFIFIDALLGIGMKGAVRDPLSFAIDYFNSLSGAKVALDIPSGLNPDTGEGEKSCHVDFIVTFHDIKVGLEKYSDITEVVDIGIPH